MAEESPRRQHRPSFLLPTKAHLEREKTQLEGRLSGRRKTVAPGDAAAASRPDNFQHRLSLSSARSPDGASTKLAAEAAAAAVDDKDEARKPRFKTFQSQQLVRHCTQVCLKVVPLFKKCSFEFVEMLAEQVTTQIFDAGYDILCQGEVGESMYVLNRGEVDILVNGNKVAVLGDGSVFGEMAAICRNQLAARRTATVRAKTICDCRVIGRDALSRTLSRFRADEIIIEAEANKRLNELRAKGMLPSAAEWWRPLPIKDPAASSATGPRASVLQNHRAGSRSSSQGPGKFGELESLCEQRPSDGGPLGRKSVRHSVDHSTRQAPARHERRSSSKSRAEAARHTYRAHSISPGELEARASIRAEMESERRFERKATASLDFAGFFSDGSEEEREEMEISSPSRSSAASKASRQSLARRVRTEPVTAVAPPVPQPEQARRISTEPAQQRLRRRAASVSPAVGEASPQSLARRVRTEPVAAEAPPVPQPEQVRRISTSPAQQRLRRRAASVSPAAGEAASPAASLSEPRRTPQPPVPPAPPRKLRGRALSLSPALPSAEAASPPAPLQLGVQRTRTDPRSSPQLLPAQGAAPQRGVRGRAFSLSPAPSSAEDSGVQRHTMLIPRLAMSQPSLGLGIDIPPAEEADESDSKEQSSSSGQLSEDEADSEEEQRRGSNGSVKLYRDLSEGEDDEVCRMSSCNSFTHMPSIPLYTPMPYCSEEDPGALSKHADEAKEEEQQLAQDAGALSAHAEEAEEEEEEPQQLAKDAGALSAHAEEAEEEEEEQQQLAKDGPQSGRSRTPSLAAGEEPPGTEEREEEEAGKEAQSEECESEGGERRPSSPGSCSEEDPAACLEAKCASPSHGSRVGSRPGTASRSRSSSAGAAVPAETAPEEKAPAEAPPAEVEAAPAEAVPLEAAPAGWAAAPLGEGVPASGKTAEAWPGRSSPSTSPCAGAKLPVCPQRLPLAAAAIAAAAAAAAAAEGHFDPTSPAALAAAERHMALKDARAGPRLPSLLPPGQAPHSARASSSREAPHTARTSSSREAPHSARASTSRERKSGLRQTGSKTGALSDADEEASDSMSARGSARELSRLGMRHYWTCKDSTLFADRAAARVACGRAVAHELPAAPLNTGRLLKPTAASHQRTAVTQLCHPEVPEEQRLQRQQLLRPQVPGAAVAAGPPPPRAPGRPKPAKAWLRNLTAQGMATMGRGPALGSVGAAVEA